MTEKQSSLPEENVITQDDPGANIELPEEAPDFACEYSASFPRILSELGISLILTSYQASRVVVVRAEDDYLFLSVKSFPRPMGLAVNPERIVLGIHSQLVDFRRHDDVAKDLEPEGLVTSCFLPRSMHVTGMINVHDIAWGNDGLWLVNSQFSCLAKIEGHHNFVPKWKPEFISELLPEDRCHLNGLAMKDGEPAFVTAFCNYDTADGWRTSEKQVGMLIDVKTNEILVDGLLMPHSPRYYKGKVYYCNSGYGQLCSYDLATKETKVELTLPGYTRGLMFYEQLLFVATSKIRKSNVLMADKVDVENAKCAVHVVDAETMTVLGDMEFTGDIDQLYDVAVVELPFTDIAQVDEDIVSDAYDFPNL